MTWVESPSSARPGEMAMLGARAMPGRVTRSAEAVVVWQPSEEVLAEDKLVNGCCAACNSRMRGSLMVEEKLVAAGMLAAAEER
ncbi:hypothetical protein L3X38_019538 [Prunus dulcis]|uniref:Uncharacterized protein n=1 Tax=Prunus dulcis TaxID=3755 RepID=A0AAD4WCS3_PRUDU|nr:hypothetical protein L3X38_019538 [Prunus dulcis]